MQKKRKVRWIVFLAFAFVLVNALLIFFDTEENIEQKSYVNEWSEAFTFDLLETLPTEGVFATTESNPVYFDKTRGSFQQYLVEKGDEVREGDALYEYEVADYLSQQASLEAEAAQIEDDITAIEAYLMEIESYEVPESDNSSGSSGFFTPDDEEEETVEESDSYAETEFMKEENIAEKEMELAQKEAMLRMVESQLEDLETTGQVITVESPFNGVITAISKELDAPLITMKASTLQVEGVLTESERKRVEEGMEAEITIPEEEELEIQGDVSSVTTFPEEVSVKRSSEYPFAVSINDDFDDMLPGYHVSVSIITDRVEGAVTAFDHLLPTNEDLFAWVMDDSGKLEYRTIETGLEVDGLVEVTEGLDSGEWLADTPRDEFRRGATFFTPIQWQELRIKETFNINPDTMKNYGLMGLMAR